MSALHLPHVNASVARVVIFPLVAKFLQRTVSLRLSRSVDSNYQKTQRGNHNGHASLIQNRWRIYPSLQALPCRVLRLFGQLSWKSYMKPYHAPVGNTGLDPQTLAYWDTCCTFGPTLSCFLIAPILLPRLCRVVSASKTSAAHAVADLSHIREIVESIVSNYVTSLVHFYPGIPVRRSRSPHRWGPQFRIKRHL